MYIFEEIVKNDNDIFDSWLKRKNINKWLGGIDDWYKYFEYVNSTPDYFLIKALFDNKIIGAITLEIIEETGNISFMVNPDEQNKGHGRKILSLFLRQINQIIKRDIKCINAYIEPNNIASKRCFESCGFKYMGLDDEDMEEYIYNL
ncbi:MAG: GNAT family N-acetyltransferase [Oscillospiraceae bacterium]|nr:GNAT family N-acetyltransferase [Oscillospiraceae bacterium]